MKAALYDGAPSNILRARRLFTATVAALCLFSATSQALQPAFLPSQYLIDHYDHEAGLPSDTVWVTREGPRGYLWIGTRGGLVRFDGTRTTTFNRETHPEFGGNDVRDIEWTPDNELWIGTYGGGVTVMKDGEFRHIGEAEGLPSQVIYDIHRGADGAMWIGSAAGLSRFLDGEIQSWSGPKEQATPNVVRIAEGSDGTIWMASFTDGISYHDGNTIRRLQGTQELDSSQVHLLTNDPELGVIAGTSTGTLYQLNKDGPNRIESKYPFVSEESLIDRDGNRWLGSYGDGLWRIKSDGSRDALSLSPYGKASLILDLLEDAAGNLWVATPQGLFRVRDSAFASFGTREGLSNRSFVVVTEPDSTLWVGTEGSGLFRKQGSSITQPPELADSDISALMLKRDGQLWVGTFGEGIVRIDGEQTDRLGKEDGLSGLHVVAMNQMRDGSILISNSGGVDRWTSDGRIEPLDANSDIPMARHITAGRDGTSWLSTNEGLIEYRDGAFRRWTTDDGLSSNTIISSYEDDRGVLWIAIRDGSLARLANGELFSYTGAHGLPLTSTFAIIEDRSRNLWISGAGGLVRAPRDDLDAVAMGEQDIVHARFFDEASGLRSRQFTGGFQPAAWADPENHLWFASAQGVIGFDPRELVQEMPTLHTYIEAVRVNGESVALTNPLQLPASLQSLEIDYSAPELSNAHTVSYRYNIGASDQTWQYADNRRTAYFNALPAGASVFRVQASLGDAAFPNEIPDFSRLEIHRAPLWYETTWSVLAAVVILAVAMTLLQRFLTRRVREREVKLKQLVDRRTTELREALVRVEANARVDSLTGIANRRHMEEQIASVWNMARRSGVPVSFLMLDIDRFKEYNDTLGHHAGDECLREIARAISGKLLREHDMVARYGGEEFLVVLYDSDTVGARGAAQRILECVQALQLPHPASDVSGFVSVSVGYSTATVSEMGNPHALINSADKALYKAKNSGRNRIATADNELAKVALEGR